MKALAIAALALLLVGCPKPTPDPVTPDDAPDAGPAPTCEAACAHVELELHCATFGSCLKICRPVQRVGYRRCLAVATSCSDGPASVDACGG